MKTLLTIALAFSILFTGFAVTTSPTIPLEAKKRYEAPTLPNGLLDLDSTFAYKG